MSNASACPAIKSSSSSSDEQTRGGDDGTQTAIVEAAAEERQSAEQSSAAESECRRVKFNYQTPRSQRRTLDYQVPGCQLRAHFACAPRSHYSTPRPAFSDHSACCNMEGQLQGSNIVAMEGAVVDRAGYMDMNAIKAGDNSAASPHHSMKRQQSIVSNTSQTALVSGAAVVPDTDGRYLLEPTARLAQTQAQPSTLKGTFDKKVEAYELPQYVNTPGLDQEPEVVYEEDIADILTKNDVPTQSSNPAYGRSGACMSDFPPPPPQFTEDFQERPTYADISKPSPAPESPIAKRTNSTKSADSVLYPRLTTAHKSPARKPYEESTLPSHSRGSPEHAALLKDNGSFVRTLLCLLFVLFLMCACSLAVSVYLLLNWPSDTKSNCDKCALLHPTGAPLGRTSFSPTVADPTHHSKQTPAINEILASTNHLTTNKLGGIGDHLSLTKLKIGDIGDRIGALEENLTVLVQHIHSLPISSLSEKVDSQSVIIAKLNQSQKDISSVKDQLTSHKSLLQNLSDSYTEARERIAEFNQSTNGIISVLPTIRHLGQNGYLFSNCTESVNYCKSTPPIPCIITTFAMKRAGWVETGVNCEVSSPEGVTGIIRSEHILADQPGYRCQCHYPNKEAFTTQLQPVKSEFCTLRLRMCKRVIF